MFDGNELVVLNGWLICGKPRKKKEMRLKAYAIWWDEKLGNVKLHQMNDMRKKNWLILKKMPRKGKWLIWKKDAQMGKECDENDENGLPNVNLPI